tara:strand:- start:22 stop:477 length:456 start_codon:yes stop_codon:yes gene_type:complete
MKITRSLCLKNKSNKTVKKLKIIYDVSLKEQSIEIVEFEHGDIKRRKTHKKYTLQEIEDLILNKIKRGYQVYSTPKEKSISFKDFQNEIKNIFTKSKSPMLKSSSRSRKKKRTSIKQIEDIINSYNKKDLLQEIKQYNSSNLKVSKKSKFN